MNPLNRLLLLSVSGIFSDGVHASIPKAASPDTPWEDLKAALSSPDILTASDANQWNEQCVQVFREAAAFPEVNGASPVVSNYLLLNQSSGLCLDHVSCAFNNCEWPSASVTWPEFPPSTSPFVIFDNSMDIAEEDLSFLSIPSMVLQPTSASDIVKAVRFCQEHDVGITVKVAGHSYFGASSAKGTLLIKMNPNYPKYAIGGSLTECATVAPVGADNVPTSNQMACALATARGKNAVLRVGGGELFDEAYRAVSFDWNSANDNMYHLVGGGAGTVSAAGGWLASGGLSGTTGMRMYGIGVDQVLAMEMVLPGGQHVRFGPMEWEDVDEGYPTTTTVTGYCNANPLEPDEANWDWTSCEKDIDFSELWFAARGGGGGSYGVLTSLHYQLHEKPGSLSLVVPNLAAYPATATETVSDTAAYFFATKYIEFLLRFLYVPESLNVAETDSRGCNSAQTYNLSPFADGLMFCYGSSGSSFVAKWQEYITDPSMVLQLQQNEVPDDVIEALPLLVVEAVVVDNYAQIAMEQGIPNPGVPEGRLGDSPMASIVPVLGAFPSLSDATHTHVPLNAIVADPAGMAQLLASDVLLSGGRTIYAMGGLIPFADDGVNAISPTRRNAAFLMAVPNEEFRNQYYSIFFGQLDMTGDFPGSSCHNHALVYEMGPLKDDWATSCPLEWAQSERDEKCISQNEASWGTAILSRLESFKAAVDPNEIFICASGVGYTWTPRSMDPEAPAPSPEPTSSGGSHRGGLVDLVKLLLIGCIVICAYF